MEIKTISIAGFYYFTNNKKLYGLISGVLVSILLEAVDPEQTSDIFLDNFFIHEDKMYFTIIELSTSEVKYFSQVDDSMVEEISIPDVPDQDQKTFKDSDFEIKISEYEENNVSDIINLSVETKINIKKNSRKTVDGKLKIIREVEIKTVRGSGVERNGKINAYYIGTFNELNGLFFVIELSVQRVCGLSFWSKSSMNSDNLLPEGSMWELIA